MQKYLCNIQLEIAIQIVLLLSDSKVFSLYKTRLLKLLLGDDHQMRNYLHENGNIRCKELLIYVIAI